MDKLAILHVLLDITETSMPYNEFALRQAADYDVSIATYRRPGREESALRLLPGDGTLRGFYRVLSEAFQGGEIDLLHVHSPHTGAFIRLAGPLFRERLPAALLTVHNSFENYKLRNRLFLLLAFPGFSRVVFCSRSSFESFPALYHRAAAGRSMVIRNGFDLDRVDEVIGREEGPGRGDRPRVITIGRLVPLKNQAALVRALGAVDAAGPVLKVIGTGPEEGSLKTLARSLDLDQRVEFTGLIPREAVYRSLQAADIFISASRGEGLPVAVLEAMACGCPVILSDIPPHREIAAGVDFIPLIDSEDHRGFAAQLKKYLELPAGELVRIGERCRAHVEENFSLQRMLGEYDHLYRALVNPDGRAR